MHATIRRFELAQGTVENLDAMGRTIAARLSRVPGFVAYVALEARDNVIATVSIFEDQVSLDEAESLVERVLAEQPSAPLVERLQVTTGEIVFQKGL